VASYCFEFFECPLGQGLHLVAIYGATAVSVEFRKFGKHFSNINFSSHHWHSHCHHLLDEVVELVLGDAPQFGEHKVNELVQIDATRAAQIDFAEDTLCFLESKFASLEHSGKVVEFLEVDRSALVIIKALKQRFYIVQAAGLLSGERGLIYDNGFPLVPR